MTLKGTINDSENQNSQNPNANERLKPEQTAESAWGVEVLEEITDIEPSQFNSENKWLATHFKIIKPDGHSEEIEATKIMIEIRNKVGEVIEVPAYTVHHIVSLHLKEEEAGSSLGSDSIVGAFNLVVTHLPDKIPFKDDVAAFEVDVEQQTGTEGVTSQQEMLESGVITQEDLDIINIAKENVFRLNIEGSNEEKQKFTQVFNLKLIGRNVSLGVRGGSVVLFYETDKRSTTKMFIVIGKIIDGEGHSHNTVFTMAPGRYMDRLPTDVKFSGELEIEGKEEDGSVAGLWARARRGEVLSALELARLDEQKQAQLCWWRGGFINSPA